MPQAAKPAVPAPAPGPFPFPAPLPLPLPRPVLPQPEPATLPSTYQSVRPEVSDVGPADAPAEGYAALRTDLAPQAELLPIAEAPAGSAPAALPDEEQVASRPARKLLDDAATTIPTVTDWITASQTAGEEAADLPSPPPPPLPPPPRYALDPGPVMADNGAPMPG